MAATEKVEKSPAGLLLLSAAPHVHCGLTVNKIVLTTLVTLLPAVLFAVYLYGFNAVRIIVVCMGVAVGTEALIQKLRNKPITVSDGTAALTGLILAFTLSPALPTWMAVIGAVVAIALGKHAFGGLGANPFNPALVGKVFLVTSFFSPMTKWISPVNSQPVSSPLEMWAAQQMVPGYQELLLGNFGGFLGESAVLPLILGGIVLMVLGYVDWRLPAAFFGTVYALTSFLGQDPVWHLLAGGLVFAAFYLAGDPVTTPYTKKGRWAFGIGAGIILVVIRQWGSYPEGVAYAILLMNGLTPLINRYLRPKRSGVTRHA
ncbi:MAG: RnfABCDGE type electron transport complex subunit D [Bacillota bacterium]